MTFNLNQQIINDFRGYKNPAVEMAIKIAVEEITSPTILDQYNFSIAIADETIVDINTSPQNFPMAMRTLKLGGSQILGVFDAIFQRVQETFPYAEELLTKADDYDRVCDLLLEEQQENERLQEELNTLRGEV